MAVIDWCIEETDIGDNNPIRNHFDNVPGANADDDRYGNLVGSECDYNQVVHLLCKRVLKPQYQNETYAVSFYDGVQLILQTNIGYKTIPSIHKIIK